MLGKGQKDLTGCLSRKKLNEDLETEIARAMRYEKTLSILLIAIEWLKKPGDAHGKVKGDELLKRMVTILPGSVRVVDKVYHYAADEMVILLPESDKVEALSTAKRLQKTIVQRGIKEEKENRPDREVTVSIGIASYPWDKNSADELLKAAHSALDRARQSAGNGICYLDFNFEMSNSDSEPVYRFSSV
ncbi:GGDEF domain-containing protein [bacterium]|nr:GGDEF domain-containing protein [bacterium]